MESEKKEGSGGDTSGLRNLFLTQTQQSQEEGYRKSLLLDQSAIKKKGLSTIGEEDEDMSDLLPENKA